MAPSAFDGVFQDSMLKRAVRVLRDPPEVDAAGDPVFDELEQELRVIADAPASARSEDTLRERYGASATEVVLILSLLEPSVAPANVTPGVEFALTYGGRPGIVRIVAMPIEMLAPITAALGQTIYGVWRAT